MAILSKHRIDSLTPVLYVNTLWSTFWSFHIPLFLKNIAAHLAPWGPRSWYKFWWSMSISTRTSFGFWVRHRTDQAVSTHESSYDQLWCYNEGFKFSMIEAKQDIRLFEIRPASNYSDPLVLSDFMKFSITTPPKYLALSYTWGSFHEGEKIGIEDRRYMVVSTGPNASAYRLESFHIGSNLAAALRQIRASGYHGYVWCDAICINQLDNEERSQQVALMADVFGSANQVFVWLGRDRSNKTRSYRGEPNGPVHHEGATEGIEVVDYLINGKGRMETPPWESQDAWLVRSSLTNTLKRDWFHRYWTIQELALAPRVKMCIGSDSIEWTNDTKLLRRAIRRIKFAEISPQWRLHEMPDLTPLLDLLSMQLLRGSYAEDNQILRRQGNLLDVLYRVRKSGRNCTDPRDQTYAMLGLIRPEELRGFVPDYNKSLEMVHAELFGLIDMDDD